MPRVHVVGYLSIDRVETASRRYDDVPGGGALYAALGAREAGAAVTLHAAAGDDFAPSWLDALGRLGIDVASVARRAGPTRRARLVHAPDGARRSDYNALWWARTAALAPPLPRGVARGDLVVLGPMPDVAADAAITHAAGARVVADTSEAFAARAPASLIALVARLAAFAPSREETRLLLPGCDDDEAALALAARGCMILQKRGAEGAAVAAGPGATLLRLEAPPADVVDPTGAGDATVGALAAGMAAGLDFVAAARQALQVGAVAVAGIGPASLGLELTREPVR